MLNARVLRDLLDEKAKIHLGPDYTLYGSDARNKIFRVIAEAVIEHLINDAEVNVTSVSGVTTGGGASGPGKGTIS